MSNWKKHAEVTSVQCNRTQDGRLRSVKVRAEYFEFEVDKEGETINHRKGENIRFRFKPGNNDRYLVLEGWKDASDTSGWVNTRVLRCLPAARAAAEAVPDVEVVESVQDLLELELDQGANALAEARNREHPET